MTLETPSLDPAGYGDCIIVNGPDGPKFDGDVPDRIGVEASALAELSPAIGAYDYRTGRLTLLDREFRQAGQDGPTVHIFEQITTAASARKPAPSRAGSE